MRLRAGVVAVACVLTAACTPSAPVQPTPTPTPSTTRPSETAVEREQRIAYEAAEAAYRTALAQMAKLLAQGGAKSAPSEIKAVAVGPYLDDLEFVLKVYDEENQRRTGQSTITDFKRAGYAPTELLLVACVDGRSVLVKNSAGRTIDRGTFAVYDLVARSSSGSWRIYSAKSRKDGQCPA